MKCIMRRRCHFWRVKKTNDLCFMRRRDWVCDQTIIRVFKKKNKWKREWSLFSQTMIFVLWEGGIEFVIKRSYWWTTTKKYKRKREWSLFDQTMIFVLWEGENEFVKNTMSLYIETLYNETLYNDLCLIKPWSLVLHLVTQDYNNTTTRLHKMTKINKTHDNMHERDSVTQDYNSFTPWQKTTTLLLVSDMLHDKTTRLQLYSLSLFAPR